MKQFDFSLDGIFTGVTPKKVVRKNPVVLVGCHNLEPMGDDYQLHEQVIDMDADGYDWGNT